MTTIVSDTVVLPNGAVPSNGHIYFTCLEAPNEATLATVVTAPLGATGAFSVPLAGAPYAVRVEHWADGRLWINNLPNVVPSGTGTATLADISAVPIPANTTDTLCIKRGDTLDVSPQMLNEWGRPIPLSGVNVASSVLGPDGVRRNLTVSKLDAAKGILQIVAAASATALWPLGKYQWDVKFRNGTTVDHTKTGTIIVEQEITP